jgi:hypothetical protein
MRITEGQIVEHPSRPEWGPGKVLRVVQDRATVYWRDLSEEQPGDRVKTIRTSIVELRPSRTQSDPWLDNLPPILDKRGELLPSKVTRLSHTRALSLFLGQFPGGFEDPGYVADERQYKQEAHEAFAELLGGGQLTSLVEHDLPEAVRRLQFIESKTNLLALQEKAALRDALKAESQARGFLLALDSMISEPTEDRFEELVNSIDRLPAEGSRVCTWPITTLFLYNADPTRFMILKPTVTIRAADRLGFSLNYQPALNWLTYAKLLELSSLLLASLQSHGAKDFIDVQSYMWLTAQYEQN